MTLGTPTRPGPATAVGGALVAVAGLLPLLVLLGTGEGGQVLFPLAALALGAGALVLGLRSSGIVGTSRVGRIAVIVFGLAPLASALPPASPPFALPIGMSITWLGTIATVIAAAAVIRARVLRGVARWALVLLAADSVLIAVMSTVPLGDVPLLFVSWNLELVRPLVLLVWGIALVLHGRTSALRRRGDALVDAWKRSTEVSGTATEQPAGRTPQH